MKIYVRQKLIVVAIVILSINILVGLCVYESYKKLQIAQSWVLHTQQVIYQSANVLSLAKDIDLAGCSFVVTQDSSRLAPLRNPEQTIFASINKLGGLMKDNASQLPYFDSVDRNMRLLIAHAYQSIDLRNKEGLSSSVAFISGAEGKTYMGAIVKYSDQIQLNELNLLKIRLQDSDRQAVIVNVFLIFMFVLMLVFTILLLVIATYYLRQNEQVRKRAAELTIANNELAYQIEEKGKRACELIVANDELAFQNREKECRASELVIANEELAFQNDEKGKRAAELIVANNGLAGAQEIANYGNFEHDYANGKSLWSEQLCNIFGLPIKDNNASYTYLLTFVHPDDLMEVLDATRGAGALTPDVSFDCRIIATNKGVRHLHVWQRIEFSPEGLPISKHVVVHDITEQTENIMQLKAQNKQLMDIAWIQSHKVRSPLATILGLAQMFKDKVSDTEVEEIIQGIYESSLQMDTVIREIVANTTESEISDKRAET